MEELIFSNQNGDFVLKVKVNKDGFMYTDKGVFIGNIHRENFEDQLDVFKCSYGDTIKDYDIDWDYVYA